MGERNFFGGKGKRGEKDEKLKKKNHSGVFLKKRGGEREKGERKGQGGEREGKRGGGGGRERQGEGRGKGGEKRER